MNKYLTYAAVRTSDLEGVFEECIAVAPKVGVRFEVPLSPTPEARTWVGEFENGWVFALADPGVWELVNLFRRVAKEKDFDVISGSTDGDFYKWSYDFSEGDRLLHRFCSDPSTRYDKHEYGKFLGDPKALAEDFRVSMARLRSQLVQFDAPSIHEFLDTLGFDTKGARRLRFVVVERGQITAPSTLAVVGLDLDRKKAAGGGETTKAIHAVVKAVDQGYSTAASLRALRFAEAGEFNEALDLFLRLRKGGHAQIALSISEELVKRVETGKLNQLPVLQRQVTEATVYGLRGLALNDLGQTPEAVEVLQKQALSLNRYLGPEHRPSMTSVLGAGLVQLRRFHEALAPLRCCLAERPLHAKSWANLAIAAMNEGRGEEARNAALLGIAADPALPVWRNMMMELRLTQADLLPQRKEAASKTYRREAQALMRGGRKLEAVAKFRLSLHHDPANIDCAWSLACAIAECTREGSIPVDQNDHELIRLLEQVAFGNPTWPWSWGTLIEMLDRRHETARALDACDAYSRYHAVRLEDLESVGIWLASVCPEIGIRMLEVLLERFVELRLQGVGSGVAREEAKFNAVSTLGWSLVQVGRVQDAVQHLTEAARISPRHVDNLANLAEAHLRLQNQRAANRAISRGLKVEPNNRRLLKLSEQTRHYQ